VSSAHFQSWGSSISIRIAAPRPRIAEYPSTVAISTPEDASDESRARLASDPSSGVEVATVEGFSAVRGRGAAIRIEIDDPQDWKWALDTWRGLRPA
jgi:hypothetical protein